MSYDIRLAPEAPAIALTEVIRRFDRIVRGLQVQLIIKPDSRRTAWELSAYKHWARIETDPWLDSVSSALRYNLTTETGDFDMTSTDLADIILHAIHSIAAACMKD